MPVRFVYNALRLMLIKAFSPRADLSCRTVAMAERGAVQLSERLADVIPALDEPDATLQRLCALWNRGRAQKKLGDTTPQGFLESLNQN